MKVGKGGPSGGGGGDAKQTESFGRNASKSGETAIHSADSIAAAKK